MIILIREFQTPDEEMKKIVLKVVAQCVGTEGVEPDYIRQVSPYNKRAACKMMPYYRYICHQSDCRLPVDKLSIGTTIEGGSVCSAQVALRLMSKWNFTSIKVFIVLVRQFHYSGPVLILGCLSVLTAVARTNSSACIPSTNFR
jgi:hypothetical protein